MSRNFSLFSAIALIALPLSAQAVTPGHDMLAQLAGVDPAAFSLSETTQIAAEKGSAREAERAAYIAGQKQGLQLPNDGHEMLARLLGVEGQGFTASELAQIAGEKGPDRRAERARHILAQKSVGTGMNPGHEMLARLLGVEGLGFSSSELAQIAGEKGAARRADRASFTAQR